MPTTTRVPAYTGILATTRTATGTWEAHVLGDPTQVLGTGATEVEARKDATRPVLPTAAATLRSGTWRFPTLTDGPVPGHLRGMTLDVLRRDGDCTNGGITGPGRNRVVAVGTFDLTRPHRPVPEAGEVVTALPKDARVFLPTMEALPVALAVRSLNGERIGHLVPVTYDPRINAYVAAPGWTMHGGNAAETSDSRWSAIVDAALGHRHYGPLHVHDRIEK